MQGKPGKLKNQGMKNDAGGLIGKKWTMGVGKRETV